MQHVKTLAALTLFAVPCCQAADWSAESVTEEAVFQAVHLVDLQQTLDIASHRGFFERSSSVDAGWAIGPHPSDRSIYAYLGADALLHLAVTGALVRWAPTWTVRVWEATTISLAGATVAHNAHIGLAVRL